MTGFKAVLAFARQIPVKLPLGVGTEPVIKCLFPVPARPQSSVPESRSIADSLHTKLELQYSFSYLSLMHIFKYSCLIF